MPRMIDGIRICEVYSGERAATEVRAIRNGEQSFRVEIPTIKPKVSQVANALRTIADRMEGKK